MAYFLPEQVAVSKQNEKKWGDENHRLLLKADELRGQLKKMELQFMDWKEKVLQKSLKDTENGFNDCIQSKDYQKACKYAQAIDLRYDRHHNFFF